MLIHGSNNLSHIKSCLGAAHLFLLSKKNAMVIVDQQIAVIEQQWKAVCEEAELSEVDRNRLWGRQFMNPFSLER